MRGFGGRIVSFRSRYGSLLFAVVLTAVVTHHFTMISIFYSNCDTNNAGIANTAGMDSGSYTKSYAETIAALMLQPSQLQESSLNESPAQQPAISKIDWSSHQSSHQSSPSGGPGRLRDSLFAHTRCQPALGSWRAAAR